MTGERIPCVNPRCLRTAPRDKYPDSDCVICRSCWRKIPPALKGRWKRLQARNRRLNRLSRRKIFMQGRGQQWARVARLYDRAERQLSADIAAYFASPPRPVGLEAFMKETGL